MNRSSHQPTVMFLSKAEVEVMTPPPNAHLISISDGPGDQARIDHRRWHSVSYHYFLDAGYTEELIEACGPDFDTTFRSYLRPLAAEKLRDRIDWAAQRAKLIVVNCYAGRSRSAAVARYIHEAYGFALEQEPAEANLTVYRLLMQDPDLLAAYEAATASHTLPSFGGAWGWLKGLVPIPGGNSGGS